jgi:hypothetical protein
MSTNILGRGIFSSVLGVALYLANLGLIISLM